MEVVDAPDSTKEVEVLTGNPRKAILALAIPSMVALAAQAVNNVINAAWVAGLGEDAMAAVGIVFPLFFIIIGFSNGIGIGASSAIARRIGRGNKAEADDAATHAIMLAVVISLILTPILLILVNPLMHSMGGHSIIEDCVEYATPILLMMIVFMLVGVMSSVLRAEGAAKRAMYILVIAAVLNLVLDPFFIYDFGLGWGLAGAAWATVLAESIALIVMMYWYFVKKNIYLSIKFKGFRFKKSTTFDIFRVGIPAASEMMIISFVSVIMNLILESASGTDAVAVYSTDWRLIQMLMIPLMGIAMAVVPVCAAAYGARKNDKIQEAYRYSLRISIVAMIAICIVTAITAPYITMIFTYSADSLHDMMVEFLRISCVFLPFLAFGFVSASLFQALGMGVRSLISTAFRNGLMIPAAFLAMTFGTLTTVWWAVCAAEIAGCLLVGIWCLATMRVLMRGYSPKTDCGNVS